MTTLINALGGQYRTVSAKTIGAHHGTVPVAPFSQEHDSVVFDHAVIRGRRQELGRVERRLLFCCRLQVAPAQVVPKVTNAHALGEFARCKQLRRELSVVGTVVERQHFDFHPAEPAEGPAAMQHRTRHAAVVIWNAPGQGVVLALRKVHCCCGHVHHATVAGSERALIPLKGG